MRNTICFLLACSVLAFSCKNDDEGTATAAAIDYFPLTVGNYWIYQWYKIDTLGNEHFYAKTDTVTVIGDTLLNGFIFTKVEGKEFGIKFKHFLRDSAGFLVEAMTSVPVLSVNTDILLGQDTTWFGNDAAFWISYEMQPDATSIDVPAGRFPDCIAKDHIVYPLTFESPVGVRTYPYYYAKGVGLVKHLISFYNSPEYFESRLVEYHIE